MKVIAVEHQDHSDGVIPLLQILADIYGFTLDLDHGGRAAPSGIIRVDPAEQMTASGGCPVISILRRGPGLKDATVRFSSTPSCPWPFRGRTLNGIEASPVEDSRHTGEVLAAIDRTPQWSRMVISNGVTHDQLTVPDDWMRDTPFLSDCLDARRFLGTLPLIEWIRHVLACDTWTLPALRACFMFDDPNLHRATYGFIDFEAISRAGRECGFHTSFATVPLDADYVNAKALRCFRDKSSTLSFLVHGNNHTRRELAQNYPSSELEGLGRQALDRIGKLEARSGLSISKVMAPPHGACSAAMLGALGRAGFEGATISHGSLRTTNKHLPWVRRLGTELCNVVEGFPVTPRFRLAPRIENRILVASYFGQAIIPVGHHWDLAKGLDLLSSTAAFINSLGSVDWTDMTAIVRTNVASHVTGDCLDLSLYSRNTTVTIPEGVKGVKISGPIVNCPECRVLARTRAGEYNIAPCSVTPVTPGERVEILTTSSQVPGVDPRPPHGAFLAKGRRIMAELRDRAMPYMPGKLRRGSAS